MPTVVSLTLGILLLSLAVVYDWTPQGARIIFPLYYLIPICILAWFVGWRPTLIATTIAAVLSLIGLYQATRPAVLPLAEIVSRILTIVSGLLVARVLATARMMLDFFLLGDQLRARIVPIRIGARLVSIPTRDADNIQFLSELKPGDIPLLIHPGTAFGSGSHATTQMCLLLLEEHLKPGQLVFDFGSGSGILSIAAAKLGARRVFAVDVAQEAARVIHDNIVLNQLDGVIRFQQGSWPTFLDPASADGWQTQAASAADSAGSAGAGADLLMANILTYVIVEALSEGLTRCVVPGGKLILSGIRTDQRDEILMALERADLDVVEWRQLDKWVALVASLPK